MKKNAETGEMEKFESPALKDDLPEEEQEEGAGAGSTSRAGAAGGKGNRNRK